jgi:5-methylcytosine-specific restriction enzyme A
MRICAAPGCFERVMTGLCHTHAARRARTWERTLRQFSDVRRLYASARWRALRQQVLHAHPICTDCTAGGRLSPSTDVHHIVKHEGDAAKFWAGPFIALCAACHSTRTRRGE